MNLFAAAAIFRFEMARALRTPVQSFLAPVLSTLLFIIVFGAAAGSSGQHYGAFVLPGALMLLVLTQSVSNAAFGIFFPKFLGTIYEVLAAPIGAAEILAGFVGAALAKTLILSALVLALAALLVPLTIAHPLPMLWLLVLSGLCFSLLGFLVGLWAARVERLQTVPLIVLTPLVFLGGAFYDVDTLPAFWAGVSQVNPVTHIIVAFRWSFTGLGDPWPGTIILLVLLMVLLAIVGGVFRTGYRLRS